MTDRTQTVLNGFTHLSPDEQKEFIDALNDYLKKAERDRKRLDEQFERGMRVTLGPVGTGCVCCGR